ncbi:MAG: hypothetical protein H7641_03430 [Candidatus Heimdallarchaeota archaeon]|nr:hypothetical protein [Candidatus Heimdallarchaeota archaeon]MCK4876614.1 hypothetical protein [Candidatus Heimdallarchaeota archaeon]
MKKGLKIFIISFSIILTIGIAFFSTVLYSYKKIDYSIGDTSLDVNIDAIFLDFTGFITTETPLEIVNGGLYAFQDLTITIKVYGQDFLISSLDGILLGEGENSLGDIKAKETWSGIIEVNVTKEISILAIQDGELKIDIDISLKISFYLFRYNFDYTTTQVIEWDSPFGI